MRKSQTTKRHTAFGTLEFSTDTMPVRDGPGSILLRGEAIDLLVTDDESNTGASDKDASEKQDRINTIPGRITGREFFGAAVNYSVECGDAIINVNEQSRRLLDIGQNVRLSIEPERIWIIQGAQ